jgi:hypothetical protein
MQTLSSNKFNQTRKTNQKFFQYNFYHKGSLFNPRAISLDLLSNRETPQGSQNHIVDSQLTVYGSGNLDRVGKVPFGQNVRRVSEKSVNPWSEHPLIFSSEEWLEKSTEEARCCLERILNVPLKKRSWLPLSRKSASAEDLAFLGKIGVRYDWQN